MFTEIGICAQKKNPEIQTTTRTQNSRYSHKLIFRQVLFLVLSVLQIPITSGAFCIIVISYFIGEGTFPLYTSLLLIPVPLTTLP